MQQLVEQFAVSGIPHEKECQKFIGKTIQLSDLR